MHYSYKLLLEELGARIKKLRKERGFTLRDMVVKHGFHLTHWQGFESGKRGLSLPSLLRIAEVLDVTLSDLLDGLGEASKIAAAPIDPSAPTIGEAPKQPHKAPKIAAVLAETAAPTI